MKKLVHYILIAIMFNWNISVFADDNKGCSNWKVVDETDKYIQESCADEGTMQARIRSKPVDGLNIEIVEAPKQNKENPIKKFKDKVEEAPKIAEKVEKIEKVEEEVIITEKKVVKLKEEIQLITKTCEDLRNSIDAIPEEVINVVDTKRAVSYTHLTLPTNREV